MHLHAPAQCPLKATGKTRRVPCKTKTGRPFSGEPGFALLAQEILLCGNVSISKCNGEVKDFLAHKTARAELGRHAAFALENKMSRDNFAPPQGQPGKEHPTSGTALDRKTETKSAARKVVTRSPSRTVRILNLPGLLPEPVEAESSYEAAFVLRAALMPACKTIIGQPFKLPASPNDYTPDYLQTFVTPRLKPAVIEIKPAGKVGKYVEVFDRAALFLKQQGYEFYVVTDRELFKDGIEQRVHRIRRYAKAAISGTDLKRITDLLSNHDSGLPLGSLQRKAAVSREAILHFLAKRLLTTGPRIMIDDSAVVRLSASNPMHQEMSLAHWFGIPPWNERD